MLIYSIILYNMYFFTFLEYSSSSSLLLMYFWASVALLGCWAYSVHSFLLIYEIYVCFWRNIYFFLFSEWKAKLFLVFWPTPELFLCSCWIAELFLCSWWAVKLFLFFWRIANLFLVSWCLWSLFCAPEPTLNGIPKLFLEPQSSCCMVPLSYS